MYYIGIVQFREGCFLISLNLTGNNPIHEQITDGVEDLIIRGLLEKDSPLPSVRELACSLAVNPNTVQKAYTTLEQKGITYSVNGKGRFVAVSKEELKVLLAAAVSEELGASVRKLKAYGFSVSDIGAYVKNFFEEDRK